MKKTFCCFLLCCFIKQATAQKIDSVHLFVDSALNIMQHRSVFSHTVDWKVVRDSAHYLAAYATSYKETLPALRYAFNQLGDKHGWLTIDDSSYRNPAFTFDDSRINKHISDVLARGPQLYNGIIAKKYAYISIHFFGKQTLEAMNGYAQRIQDSLCKNVNAQTKGVIIDVRLNGGGNVFPMLQGVINVLGEGKFTESVNGLGKKGGAFIVENSSITLHGNHGEVYKLELTKQCKDLSRLPVAILIGPVTGSSAEQVAIAFSSRKKSVLIGERSAGFVTANNGFRLPGNNNGIVIAESYTVNMKGQVFIEDVKPDIEVIGGDNFLDREKDAKVRAAIKWLKKQQ